MRIYSLTKVLALPAIIVIAILLARFFGHRSPYSVYIMIPAIYLVILYIFHGQIDHWWLSKRHLPLDQKMRDWFVQYSEYYNALSEEEKNNFEHRLNLYLHGRLFQSVGTTEMKDVPYDIQAIIASNAVRLTMSRKDYLLGDYDRIYLYKHPFPSPDIPHLHTMEVNHADGTIILSTQEALPGVALPSKHFNIAMMAFAEAYIHHHKDISWPDVNGLGWDQLSSIIGISRDEIVKLIGHDQWRLLSVHIVAFMECHPQYRDTFPDTSRQLSHIFS